MIRSDDPAYRALHIGLMRSVLERLDEGFKHFFRRVEAADARPGFPRFKGRRRGLRSLSTTGFSVRQSGKRFAVHVKGIGRFVVKRMPPRQTIKLLRIVKTPLRVMLHFCCERTIDVVPSDSEPAGIDVGVASQATLSTGEALAKRVPDTRRRKRLQRRLSRARRGSRNREKKRLAYARECERLSERERQHVHRVTTGDRSRVSQSGGGRPRDCQHDGERKGHRRETRSEREAKGRVEPVDTGTILGVLRRAADLQG